MEQSEFERLAEAVLRQIENGLDACGADLDVEVAPGGVLEVEFADGSKMVINRHAVAREIWVAARSGGFHFRYGAGAWRDTRSGEELLAAIGRLASQQAGESVRLA
jgi:iron-sulfur cluster assembly protein CyaY